MFRWVVFYFDMHLFKSAFQQISRYVVKKPQIEGMFFGRDKVQKKEYFWSKLIKRRSN